jgi:hypothetical protein
VNSKCNQQGQAVSAPVKIYQPERGDAAKSSGKDMELFKRGVCRFLKRANLSKGRGAKLQGLSNRMAAWPPDGVLKKSKKN